MSVYSHSYDLSLYLVLDPSLVRVEKRNRSLEFILEEAIRGGVSIVQLREKNCSDVEFLSLVRRCVPVLKKYRIPFLINDRIDIAQAVKANGIHLGQSDLDVTEARQRLGSNAIVGLSVESVSQAKAAENLDVDYLGVSAIFKTDSKQNLKHYWGLEGLRDLRSLTFHRLIAIGGIDETNVSQVMAAGADGIAVVAAICNSFNPRQAASNLKALVN